MSWLFDLFKEIPLSSVLREKLTTAQERINTLEAEVAALREKDANSQMRMKQLEQQVAVIEWEKNQLEASTYKTTELPHKDDLNEIKSELLRIIAGYGECRLYVIEDNLNYWRARRKELPLISSRIEHYLGEMTGDELAGEGYIHIAYNSMRDNRYSLLPRGQRYLEDNDLWPPPGEYPEYG